MKRYLFLLIASLSFPLAGICQTSGEPLTPLTNVLGVDVNLAFGPSSTATWDPSLSYRIQVTDHFRVGIGDVSFGSADLISGTRYAIMGGPVVEYFAPISTTLSYSIFAGVPLQNRWGAGIAHGFGTAPYASTALDYYFSPVLAVAGAIRIQYVATETYQRICWLHL